MLCLFTKVVLFFSYHDNAGVVISHAIGRLDVAGQDINDVLQRELQAKGIELNSQEIEEVLRSLYLLTLCRKSLIIVVFRENIRKKKKRNKT